jgi:hypothetical protein
VDWWGETNGWDDKVNCTGWVGGSISIVWGLEGKLVAGEVNPSGTWWWGRWLPAASAQTSTCWGDSSTARKTVDQTAWYNPSHLQATFTSKAKVGKGMLYHTQQNIKASCSMRAFILLVSRGTKMVWKCAIYEFKVLTIRVCPTVWSLHSLTFNHDNTRSLFCMTTIVCRFPLLLQCTFGWSTWWAALAWLKNWQEVATGNCQLQ